jgi:hypothetical protein
VLGVVEAGVEDELGPVDVPAEVGPVVVALQHDEAHVAAVLGRVQSRRAGFVPVAAPGIGVVHGSLSWSDERDPGRERPHPAASSDTSTTEGSPCRSRFSSAAAMPPAMVIPPIESPQAGPAGAAHPGSSSGEDAGGVSGRHQKLVMS